MTVTVSSDATFAPQIGHELAQSIERVLARLREIDPAVADRRSDTRERILGVALRLFASAGFQGTAIRTIANEVGIKAPGVYSHFDSKETILAAALARALGDFLRFVTGPDPELEGAGLLEFVVRKHVRFQIANAQVAMPSDSLMANVQFLQEIEAGHRDTLRDAQRAYVDLMADAVANYQGDPSQPRTRAHVAITMCDGVNRWYREGGRMGPADVEDFMWTLVRTAMVA